MSAKAWPDPGVTRVGPYFVETRRAYPPGTGHMFDIRLATGERIDGGHVSVERSLSDVIERAIIRCDGEARS